MTTTTTAIIISIIIIFIMRSSSNILMLCISIFQLLSLGYNYYVIAVIVGVIKYNDDRNHCHITNFLQKNAEI